MKEELRKVRFNLNVQNLTIGDLGFEDPEEILKERLGYFHCWGNVDFYDSEEGQFKLRKVAIVEESKTGKIFEISPKCIEFEESIDKFKE